MEGQEAKQQLAEAEEPTVHHHEKQPDPQRRKRPKRSTLLPSIASQQQPQLSSSSSHSLPPLRPHSADSSAPRPPFLPLAVPPLFSSTHRITAAGTIVHLTQPEIDALDLQSLSSSERIVQSRRADGLPAVGRERIILLEPLVISAKVDSGLRDVEAPTKEAEEDAESHQQQPQSEDPEERRRRRRERTEQRRRHRQRQREERETLLASQQAEERKEQMEEKIEAEPGYRLSSAAAPPSTLSPASQARLLQAEMRRYHQQADLYDGLLPSPTSLSSLATTADAIEPSPAAVSAAIQAHVTDRILGPHSHSLTADPSAEPSPIIHPDQVRRREAHWLEKRNRTKPKLHTQTRRHRADDILLWSEQHPIMQAEVGPDDAWMSRLARNSLDLSSGSSSSTSSPSSPSSTSPSLPPSTLPPHTSETSLTAEDRVSYTLKRIGEASQPSTSRPSTSHGGTSTPSRPSSSGSTRPRSRPTSSQGSTSELRRRGRAEAKRRGGRHSAAGMVTGERGRRSVVYDQKPVQLEGGGEIEREAVLMHHARDVQLVVDAMVEAVGVGIINLPAPISLLTVPDRGLGGAVNPPSSLISPTSSTPNKAPTTLLTTVMHGKDMMIVLNWLTHIARTYITDVLFVPGFSSSNSLSPDASSPNDPSPSGEEGARTSTPASMKRALPPLEFLGLDRRALYTNGLTHESIDQVYSGVYAYSAGFFHLLEGLVLPALSSSSDLSGAALMHKLWCGYKRLLELSHPALYHWVMQCMRRVGREEAEAVWEAHLKEVERSAVVVKGRREEVRGLKVELLQTNEAYEDTLDGVSEARVTAMSLREANYREEKQLAEISEESIADMTAKAARALSMLQAVEDDSVRVREKRAMTVRAIVQARADLHLARLHLEDMKRLIGERSVINGVLEGQYGPALSRVEAAEAEAREKVANSLALSLLSLQHLHYNQQVRLITDAQLAWLAQVKKRGLLSHVTDAWPELKADLSLAFTAAQAAFTDHVKCELALDGVAADRLEEEVRWMQANAAPMTAELKAKLGLTSFEQERDRRVAAAQASHAHSTAALSALTSQLAQLTSDLAVIHSSYTEVYRENDAIITANAGLQTSIDGHLARLAALAPQQSTTRSSIAFGRAEIDDFVAECRRLPARIDSLRASTAALVPRQAELNAVEVAKGAVYRSLLLEKEKLDAEFARSVRDGEEMKGEMEELARQLGEMEDKAAPLWRELDGKMGVLEREMEYQKREWENHQMRLCEEETKRQWRLDLLHLSEEKLQPRQAQLRQAQADADEVRALLAAEHAVHDGIRLELRDTREQLQAQTRDKEGFLAAHIASSHDLQERKAKAMGHIAHLRDVLEHTRSELRASHAINEQMQLGFDKRLQQWKQQLGGRRDANHKKVQVDTQRKEVHMVKRRELADAIDVVQREWEVEDERRRELQERLWMMQEETQAEQQRSAQMQRERERLERLHTDLTLAAPHLRTELERVSERDRAFDVRQVEAAIQVELEKQAQLMRRVAVLEEEQWQRQMRRCERWMQTDPSRHFRRVRPEDIKERFVLGQELGLMTDAWMRDKQREMRQREVRQVERGTSPGASRSRRPSLVVLNPSPAVLQRTIDQSRLSVTEVDDGSEGGRHPASLWESSLHSSSQRRAEFAIPTTARRRAATHAAGEALHQRAPSSINTRPAGKSERATHTRTQSSMPAPSWHLPRSLVPARRHSGSGRGKTVEEEEEREPIEEKEQWASPLTAWHRGSEEEQSHPLHNHHSRQLSRQSPSPDPRGPLPRSPSPHPSSPRSSISSSHSTRSSRSVSRPLTAESRADSAASDAANAGDRRRSRSRTLSRSPSPQPPSASGAMPTLNRQLSNKLTPSSHSRTVRASTPSLDASTFPAPRGRSPSLSAGVMDPATLIPQTALRPTPPLPHTPPPSRQPPPAPHPPPSTISAPALEQLYAATALSFDVPVPLSRRLTREVVAEELDAKAAREEAMAYERYLQEGAGGGANKVEVEETIAEEGEDGGAAEVQVTLSPLVREAADMPTNARHRGAVQLAASPVAGTLTEWLELQVRSAMDFDDGDRRRRQAASLSASLPHQHLSLMMPDPVQQRGGMRTEGRTLEERVPELSLAQTEAAEVKVEGAVWGVEEGVEQTERAVQFVEGGVGEVGPAAVMLGPLVSPLTGTVFERGEKRVRGVASPETRGVEVRMATPQARTVRKELLAKVIHEDEKPGRLPNYVKRSIRAMYQQQKQK